MSEEGRLPVASEPQDESTSSRTPTRSRVHLSAYAFALFALLASVHTARACSPGKGPVGPPGRRTIPVKLKPLPKWARVPQISELTYGAAGPLEENIPRDSFNYHQHLVVNENTNVLFDSDDARRMTRRCSMFLDTLNNHATQRWSSTLDGGQPEPIIRVIHGWREKIGGNELMVSEQLHYEGRAVDISFVDQGSSNMLGELAALAVQSGFDYVYFKGTFVHCSCVSDNTTHVWQRGCFDGESTATTEEGKPVPLRHLRPGDRVMSFDDEGRVRPDTFLAFIHREERDSGARVVSIGTEDGAAVRLTENHLVYLLDADDVLASNGSSRPRDAQARFAGRARVGQYLHTTATTTSAAAGGRMKLSRIVSVERRAAENGVYAPLTSSGRIVVDGVAASCYAVVECQRCAHHAMAPVRLYHRAVSYFRRDDGDGSVGQYSRLMQWLASMVMPDGMYWPSLL